MKWMYFISHTVRNSEHTVYEKTLLSFETNSNSQSDFSSLTEVYSMQDPVSVVYKVRIKNLFFILFISKIQYYFSPQSKKNILIFVDPSIAMYIYLYFSHKCWHKNHVQPLQPLDNFPKTGSPSPPPPTPCLQSNNAADALRRIPTKESLLRGLSIALSVLLQKSIFPSLAYLSFRFLLNFFRTLCSVRSVPRELSFLSSRPNWDPHPLTRRRVCIPPFGSRAHSLGGEGMVGPNPNEGTDTVVL